MLKDTYHHELLDQKNFVLLTKLNDVCLRLLRNVWIEFVFVFRAFPRVAFTAQSFYIATCGYVHDKTFVSKKKHTHTQ